MATVPPLYSFPGVYYNPVFFPSVSGFLTLTQANSLFLARTGIATSVAISTSFGGAVIISGLLTLTGGLSITGGVTIDTLTVNTLSTLNASTIINGSLTINATNLIIGQTTFTLPPILPTGYQFITIGAQTITGLKTFTSVITTAGINDSLSITSPNVTGSTIVNGGTFNATNIAGTSNLYGTTIGGTLACNIINNTSSTLPYILNCLSVPIPTTTSTLSGMGIGWNALGGIGECDLINYGQFGGGGGFNFSTITNVSVNRNLGLLSVYANGGFTINSACGQLRMQDINSGAFNTIISQGNNQSFYNTTGINSQIVFQCANASAVGANVMAMNTTTIQPFVNFSPQSTTTFNSFHPTTTLGNNLSTNTTQYATVGYVNNSTVSLLNSANVWTNTNTFNTSIPTTTLTPSTSTQFATVGYVNNSTSSLLNLNNTWNGNNNFYGSNRYINIGAGSNSLAFGASTGNSGNILIGDSSSLTVVTAATNNICIAPVLSNTMYLTSGSSNIAIGGQNAVNLTTGNNNLILGNSTATGLTTGSNNTVIGVGSWTSGNFSNCTTIGYLAPGPVTNNSVILGSTAATVYVKGACELNNTYMTGTTVVSADLQVNVNLQVLGNIIQPIGTIYTAGINTTFTTIPPYILYLPAASMNFTLPVPSAANAGMQFIIRRTGVGSASTVTFLCTGSPAVWVALNANAGTTGSAVASLNPSQSMWFSSGTFFYQLI